MISPAQLFLLGKPIDEAHSRLNKYTYLGYTKKFPHYRILTLGDILAKKYIKDKDLPGYVYDFIGQNGEVLIIANLVNKYIPMVQLRTLRGEKAFSVFGSQTKLFYGLGFLPKTFTYGEPILLVEGLADRDTASAMFPNVLGTMTAGLTTSQLEILKLLTNTVILAYDNDKAGRMATKRDAKKLKDLGFNVKYLFQYGELKDIGDVAELYYQQNDFDFQVSYKYYQNKLKSML